MAEEAEPDLSAGHDGPAPRGIPARAGEGLRDRVVALRRAAPAQHQRERAGEPHPNVSAAMVRNHASASTASTARVARGASDGLTPPAPGTSAS